MLYSSSALLPAPEVRLLKTAFIAAKDIVYGVGDSSFRLHSSSSKIFMTVSSPGIIGTNSSSLSASSSDSRSSFILLKALATVLFFPFWYSRKKSYFASLLIHLCFMASMLGDVRKYVSGLLSVQTLKRRPNRYIWKCSIDHFMARNSSLVLW